MQKIMIGRLAWTDYCTVRDKKTGEIKQRTACEVWFFPNNEYTLKFVDVTPKEELPKAKINTEPIDMKACPFHVTPKIDLPLDSPRAAWLHSQIKNAEKS